VDVFTLVGTLTLAGADKVNQQLSQTEQQAQKVQKNLRMAGAALTALGAAGLKFVDTARKTNAQLAVTALNLDITTEEMRDLTLATANVTFTIDEAVKTFDLLSRAGIESTEILQSVATAFDTLGDAIDVPASIVTERLVPTMKTFNLTATEMAEKIDPLTYLFRNTTVSLDDWARMVGYVTPEIVAMGLTTEDMIGILAELEEQGYSGEVMTRAFRSAVTLATKEQIPLNEALGISTEKIESYKVELEGATGITQRYADAANTQYGIMDKLKFLWSKLTLTVGSYLAPLEPVLAVMTAMGPAMIFLSTSMGKSALMFILHSAAVMKSSIASALHMKTSIGLAGAQAAEIAATMGSTAATMGEVGATVAATRATIAETDATLAEVAATSAEIGVTTAAIAATGAKIGATTAATGATIGATKAQWGLNRAMMANPIIAIIAGITALVIALIYMWRNWESVTIKMEGAWLKFKRLIGLGVDTTQVRLDALEIEKAWIEVTKKVKESYDTMLFEVESYSRQAISALKQEASVAISETESVTSQAITEAEQVRDEEKKIFEDRAQFYRDLTAERLDLIDEQMMAELVAMDPTGEVARLAAKYNESLGKIKGEGAERDREIEEDRLKELKDTLKNEYKDNKKALEDQLDDLEEGDDARRESLEDQLDELEEGKAARERILKDQIADIEEAWEKEERGNKLHLAIMELDSEDFFENQKTLADQHAEDQITFAEEALAGMTSYWNDTWLPAQIEVYQDDFANFKQLNIDKYEDLVTFVEKYNELLKDELITGEKFELPAGPPPLAKRKRPTNPIEAVQWAYDTMMGYQHGGPITEPTLLYGLKSQRPYAIAGEAGTEYISPAKPSGGNTFIYNVSFPGLIVREEPDIVNLSKAVGRELKILQDRTNRRMGISG